MPKKPDANDGLASIRWYWRDWRASTARAVLSPLERGVYRELLDAHYASDDCTIPDDDHTLAALAGVPLATWKRMRDAVLRWIPLVAEGKRQHPKAKAVWDEGMAFRAAQRRKAEMGAGARWGGRGDAPGNAPGIPRASGDECPGHTSGNAYAMPGDALPSPSPSPSEEAKPQPQSARARPPGRAAAAADPPQPDPDPLVARLTARLRWHRPATVADVLDELRGEGFTDHDLRARIDATPEGRQPPWSWARTVRTTRPAATGPTDAERVAASRSAHSWADRAREAHAAGDHDGAARSWGQALGFARIAGLGADDLGPAPSDHAA